MRSSLVGCPSCPRGGWMYRPRRRGEERGQVVREQVPEALDRQVGRRIGGERVRIARIVALPREDGGDSAFPYSLDGGQDAELVVHQDIVVSGITPLDVVELALLVDIDQDVPVHDILESRAL